MSTRRQTIVDNIKDRLKVIHPDNGHDWTPKKRYEWLTEQLDEGSLPAISVKDTKDAVSFEQSYDAKHTLTIEVDLYLAGDDAKPQIVRQRAAEVLAALGAEPGEDEDLGDFMELKGVEILSERNENLISAVAIDLEVTYNTPQWEI